MYRTSNDLRFVKNREALRRAYIDLVKQKGTAVISVKALTEQANVNRMTFYSHYDTISDILAEYVDDMTATILQEQPEADKRGITGLLERATALMREEIDFFRLVAQADGFEQFRTRFRRAFQRIFEEELAKASSLEGPRLTIAAAMVASGVTYAYLDWLAGTYGDLPLEDLIGHFEAVLARFIES